MQTPEIFVIGSVLLIGILIVLGQLATRFNEMRSRFAALSRVEAKLDLLLEQSNIKFDPYAALPREVVEAARAGERIKAIKLYMQSSGAGLKEARDFITEYQQRSGVK